MLPVVAARRKRGSEQPRSTRASLPYLPRGPLFVPGLNNDLHVDRRCHHPRLCPRRAAGTIARLQDIALSVVVRGSCLGIELPGRRRSR